MANSKNSRGAGEQDNARRQNELRRRFHCLLCWVAISPIFSLIASFDMVAQPVSKTAYYPETPFIHFERTFGQGPEYPPDR